LKADSDRRNPYEKHKKIEQFPVGYGNTGKHYSELGGFSDEQLVELERALSGADCK
jgi:hypothetical protein